MIHSRRQFIRLAGRAAAGLPLLPLAGRISPLLSGQDSPRRQGLLFDAADLPRLRVALNHPRLKAYWDSVVHADLAADAEFLRSGVRLHNHVSDMLRVRMILERTSFAYAVTGDRTQGAVALRAVDKILEYPKWDYFLEGGKDVIGLQRAPEATIAMSCARQWLEDLLSKETAAEMETQIATKGAPACYRTLYGMKYPDRVKGWGFDPDDDYPYRFDLRRWPVILNTTNLKMIPIAGLGVAGCLLRGRRPEADSWIAMAIESAEAFSTMFGSDGCYGEGVGYWSYTVLHLTMLVEVVRRTLGRDLSAIINFPGTVRYGLRMSMPTEGRPLDCVNFSDAWMMGDVSVAAWTARRFDDPVAQFAALHAGELKGPCAAAWFDPERKAETPGPEMLDVRFTNDWVVGRSGWELADGVAAMRSGGPANHEHADRNSVIFKAYSERIYHDPYKAAYSYTDPLWLLRSTAAHTAILVDGKGHQYHDGHEGTNASQAKARVVAYRSSDQALVVTSDATEAYALVNEDIAEVQRTLIFLKPDVLALFDRVRLNSKPLSVQARFQVDNSDGKGTVAADGLTFRIGRPTAGAATTAFATGHVSVHTGTLPLPAEKGIYPYAEVVSAPSLDHRILTVCAASPRAGPGTPEGRAPAFQFLEKDGTISVNGTHLGRMVSFAVTTTSPIPVVTIG